MYRFVLLFVIGVFISGFAHSTQAAKQEGSKHWLADAPSEQIRIKRLEKYLRGFDQPMWEVGERYAHFQRAIDDKNYRLALYHWKKIRTTIENGLMKRPARKANAKQMFLDKLWWQVYHDLSSEQATRAQAAKVKARTACMACHIAEEVGFINQQPLFQATYLH